MYIIIEFSNWFYSFFWLFRIDLFAWNEFFPKKRIGLSYETGDYWIFGKFQRAQLIGSLFVGSTFPYKDLRRNIRLNKNLIFFKKGIPEIDQITSNIFSVIIFFEKCIIFRKIITFEIFLNNNFWFCILRINIWNINRKETCVRFCLLLFY